MCGRVACTLSPNQILQKTGAKGWENKNCLKCPKASSGKQLPLNDTKKEIKQEIKDVKQEEFKQEDVKQETKQEGVKQEIKPVIIEKQSPQKSYNTDYQFPSYNNGPCVFLPCLVPERATSQDGEGVKGEVEEKKEGGNLVVNVMRWGLIPKFAKDTKLSNSKTINARDDRLATSPLWKPLFKSNRCAVVVQGYFEWQTRQSARKQPYFFHFPEDRPLVLAGLWDCWKNGPGKYNDPFEELYSCTIVTRAATPGVCADVHERMPVILHDEKDIHAWISHGRLDMLQSQKTPPELVRHPVDFGVGNMKNNYADLILPLSEFQEKKGGIASFFAKAPPKKLTVSDKIEKEEDDLHGKRKATSDISQFFSPKKKEKN